MGVKYLLVFFMIFSACAYYNPDIHFYYPDDEESGIDNNNELYCVRMFKNGEMYIFLSNQKNESTEKELLEYIEVPNNSKREDCKKLFEEENV